MPRLLWPDMSRRNFSDMSARPVLSQLFSLLEAYGVKAAVCSPGSRNAALLQEADRREGIKKYVVVDERSAGFIALGLAMVSRSPVALICTSGSALLNYAPAAVEAYYQGIPLIVVSADRPEIWINQDDSQTIVQPGALANVVKASYDLDGDNREEDYQWFANRTINEALMTALAPKEGPVHINIHLNGKINTEEHIIPEVEPSFPLRKIFRLVPPSRLDKEEINSLAELAMGKRIMLVAGFMPPDHKLQKAVATLAGLKNVAVMAETISNLHLPKENFMVDSALFPLSPSQARELAPELVISLGGALISRKLKEFLREVKPEMHWALGHSDNVIDYFRALTTKIEVSPASFLQTFGKRLFRIQKALSPSMIPDYEGMWHEQRTGVGNRLKNVGWSDLKALDMVLNSLPESANLFLSNGTSVRYAQIIPYRLTHATYSNRGVSGIEGSTSTAIGGMLAYGGMTCLISGDMSFGYDMAALASDFADERMRIVVLDNGGGDIFRFIEATRHLDIREDYLCADMNVPVEKIARAYEWEYFYAASEKELRKALREFFKPKASPSILHIDTSRNPDNASILRNFLNG